MIEEEATVPMLHASVESTESRPVCQRLRARKSSSKMQWRGTLFSFYNYLRRTRSMNDNFRLVSSDGRSLVQLMNVPGEQVRYLLDIFTTVIDAKWRYIVTLFSLSYCVSWALFGSIWYLVTVAHLEHGTGKNCVENVNSWTSAFLFSVETQTTIGYGGRQVTPDCPSAVVLLVVQTLIGMLINCSMLGLIFAKLSRPKNRAKTVIFSTRATVTKRNAKLCLCWQVIDIAKRRLYDCNIRAFCVKESRTLEGELIPFQSSDLRVTIDQQNVDYTLRVFPMLPLTVMHMIDEESPLYNLSAEDVKDQGVEVVVVLEGTVPTTGMVTQAIASYTSENIDWGYTFLPSIDRTKFIEGDKYFDVENLSRVRKDSFTPRYSQKSYRQKSVETDSTDCDTLSRQASTSLSSLSGMKSKSSALDVVISIDGEEI